LITRISFGKGCSGIKGGKIGVSGGWKRKASFSFGARMWPGPIEAEKNIDALSSYFMLKMLFERIDPINPANPKRGR